MKNYKFSIVLASKNSYPYIVGTIESLKNQIYKNFEVIVIDCLSKDKTIEYLRDQSKFLNIKIFSEPDDGISDAYNKGISKTTGDIISLLATDERYFDETLLKVNEWYSKYPKKASISGSLNFINKEGIFLYNHKNENINFHNHITTRKVPAIATIFFNKNILSDDLYYNVSQKTVPDYEFWARVLLKHSESKFMWMNDPIVKAIDDDISMSKNFRYFDQLTSDKIEHFNNFYIKNKNNLAFKELDPNTCRAEICMWAAESLKEIKSDKKIICKFLQMSNKYQLKNTRLKNFIEINQNYYFQHDTIFFSDNPKKYRVIKKLNYFSEKILGNDLSPWGYRELLNIQNTILFKFYLNKYLQKLINLKNFYSIKVTFEIFSGSIGISQIINNKLLNEVIYNNTDNKILLETIFPIKEPASIKIPLMIRNAGNSNSKYEIKSIELIYGS